LGPIPRVLIEICRPHIDGMHITSETVPAHFRDPGSVVITVAFDNKRVSLPVAYRVSQPTLLWRILRKFPSIRPDGAPGMAPFEELKHSVRQHREFHSVVVCEPAWIAQRIAYQHAVFRICGWNFRPGRVEHLLSQRRQWGNVLHIQFRAVIATYSRQVMRIECMAL